jgi:hypothetical protein
LSHFSFYFRSAKVVYFIKDPNGVIEKMNNLQTGFKQAVFNPIKTSQIKDEEIQ